MNGGRRLLAHGTVSRRADPSGPHLKACSVCARAAVALLMLAALCAPFACVRAAEPVRIVETRSVAPKPRSDASHELTLHVYTFQGTRWSSDTIVESLAQAARLLAPCGVAFASVDVNLVDAPARFRIYSTPVSRELLRVLPVKKPALFFVDDTHNRPAFDAEAIGASNARTRPELIDTIWVAYGARDLPFAIAHELVHMLADSGEHSSEPANLMQPETAPRNSRLSTAQCERIRAQGSASGILEPRR